MRNEACDGRPFDHPPKAPSSCRKFPAVSAFIYWRYGGHGVLSRDTSAGKPFLKPDDSTKARYLNRAAELRAAAAHVTDETERAVLIQGAEAYERMAGWKPKEPIARTEK